MKNTLNISIVIPVFNEEENILELYQELTETLNKLHKSYEIIFVNDGSRDDTQKVIEKLHNSDNQVIGIQMKNHFGKAAALQTGFDLASGSIIITLDGDLQDVPEEIPRFIAKLEEGYDLVSGWKQNRKDSFLKNKSSLFFNFVTRTISGVKLKDFNCGFKAYNQDVAKDLNLYGELHRYIPVIAASQGYRIGEIEVKHRARKYGKSKYNLLRFLHGFLDLTTVLFITKFRTRPLHFFGYIGIFFFTLGFIVALYLSFIRIFSNQLIGGRPLLLFSVMLIIMGVQIVIVGLVGEQITSLLQKNSRLHLIKRVVGKNE